MYYFGKGATVPAIIREIVEADLIEKYGWLPQEIASIPYKKLQILRLINKQKNVSIATRSQVESLKRNANVRGPRKFTREV